MRALQERRTKPFSRGRIRSSWGRAKRQGGNHQWLLTRSKRPLSRKRPALKAKHLPKLTLKSASHGSRKRQWKSFWSKSKSRKTKSQNSKKNLPKKKASFKRCAKQPNYLGVVNP